jgi:hypothetical protein
LRRRSAGAANEICPFNPKHVVIEVLGQTSDHARLFVAVVIDIVKHRPRRNGDA